MCMAKQKKKKEMISLKYVIPPAIPSPTIDVKT